MRWPLSTRSIQPSLSMTALRVDCTFSGARCSSYSPLKKAWASARKRSWIQLDQPSSGRPQPGLLTNRPLSWDVGMISVHKIFSPAPDKAQKGPSRSRTLNNKTVSDRTATRAKVSGLGLAGLRMFAIRKPVQHGSLCQIGQSRCKSPDAVSACRACSGAFLWLQSRGKTQQNT